MITITDKHGNPFLGFKISPVYTTIRLILQLVLRNNVRVKLNKVGK